LPSWNFCTIIIGRAHRGILPLDMTKQKGIKTRMDISGINGARQYQQSSPAGAEHMLPLHPPAACPVTAEDAYSPGGEIPLRPVNAAQAAGMILDIDTPRAYRVQWKFDPCRKGCHCTGFTHNPAIGPDGTIYTHYLDLGLMALNGETGEQKWNVPGTKGYTEGPILTPGNTVIAWYGADYMAGYDAESGHEKWRIPLERHGVQKVIQGPEGLLVVDGLRLETMVGIDGDTGMEKWSMQSYREKPVISRGGGDTFFVPENGEKIHVHDAKTGKKKCVIPVKKKFHREFYRMQCSPGGDVLLDDTSGRMLMLDGRTGRKKWDAAVENERGLPETAWGQDGTLYYATDTEKIYSMNADTGSHQWIHHGKFLAKEIAVAPGGDVFAINHQDRLYAIDGGKGTLKWDFTTRERPGTITIAPGGSLLLADGTSTLQSLVYDDTRLAEKLAAGAPGKDVDPADHLCVDETGEYIIIDGIKMPVKKE